MTEIGAFRIPRQRGELRAALVAYARAAADSGRIDVMSLRAAARALGVSSGAVYKHFDDKDQLLKAVAHQGFAELCATFEAIRPRGSAAPTAEIAIARAFEMGRAFVAFADANPSLWRMMFGRIGNLCCAEPRADAARMQYTVLDCTTENCRDLHRLGAIPDPPSEADIRFLWAAIHGAADLSQSGLNLPACAMRDLADQTTDRSLRALGCTSALIDAGQGGTSVMC